MRTAIQRAVWGLLLISGCGGDGGGCLAPADFPADERIPNAVQVRIAEPGFQRIGDNVEALITAAFGSTRLGFEPLCEGDVRVCCGLPADTCGITLDLQERAGDPPRLSFTSLGDGRRGLNVAFNTRIRTDRTLDVEIDIPVIGTRQCAVDIDTTASGSPDISISASLVIEEDPMTLTTRIGLADLALTGIEAGDIAATGAGVCSNVEDRIPDIEEGLREALNEQAPRLLEVPLCKSCMSDADCGVGTCNEELVCELPGAGEEGPRCLQQLGTAGRLPAGELFGELAGDAALDLYLVANSSLAPAGGLSFSGNSGIYLPTVGGLAPGSPTCAPVAPKPPVPGDGIELSEMMSANTLDDLGEFDFGIALHKSFLDRAGWAFHQAGLFCTTVDTGATDKLNADSMAVLFPSLVDLVDGANTPIAVRLRPQTPPTFRMDDPAGAIVVVFKDFDVDFFMNVRERNVRLFSARSDVAIPIDLGTDMNGAITPLIGDMSNAFTNIRITTPGLLAEPGDELAAKFEAIGGLSVNMLVGAIGEFELPALPFLSPTVLEKGLRGLDGGEFLGLFGKLEVGGPAGMPLVANASRVSTTAELVAVTMPPVEAYAAPRLDRDKQPSIELALGGDGPLESDLEWQIRIDGGAWSPYRRDPRQRISRIELWVPAIHQIEIRARHWDRPESTDPTPIKLMVDLRPRTGVLAGVSERGAETLPFTDSKSENGCASSSSGKGALWLVLAMLVSAVMVRRRRETMLILLLALGSQAGCLIGSDTPQEKGPAYGRWSDVASDGVRAVASSYESRKGDLVLGTVVATGVKAFEIVDEDGDVGAWSSVELFEGFARIAYQDRSNGRLKFATESIGGFDTHVIDEADGVVIGRYASLATRPGGGFGIAYLAENKKDDGGMITQLRVAETTESSPSAGSWTREPLQFARVETVEMAPEDSVPLGTGLYSKLVYTSAGDPVIAYCDTTAPALVLARRSGGQWSHAILDDNVETGPCAFAALAIADDDTVHVAYQTIIANDVRYVRVAPGAMSGEVVIVDDGARDGEQRPVGGSTSITVDDKGSPIIVYQDGYTLELRIARRAGGAWSHEVAASSEAALGFSIGVAWFKDQLVISSGAVNREKLQAHQVTTTVIK